MQSPSRRRRNASIAHLLALATILTTIAPPAAAQATAPRVRNGDYIVAVVNSELVTAAEVERRVQQARAEGARGAGRVPSEAELRRQAVDALIEERVVVTHARDSGARVDEPELDRAVRSVAAQNQLNLEQLRARLAAEGIDYPTFRANLRDQILVERVREREVYQRIRVSDEDVERFLEARRAESAGEAELNLAQVLVAVPEGASDAVVAERRARAETALARVRAGENFALVARELSDDPSRERGGEIGLRPPARLPDLFVEATKALPVGGVATAPVRSGAGFHVLKVLERREPGSTVTQTRARHILLRVSPQLDAQAAAARLAEFRRQIDGGQRRFEDIARQYSEDGSAAAGGDLGFSVPGTMVPEFEEAMNRLPVGGVSQPVVSRFGVHLIQVTERREVPLDAAQQREQARNVLRERKFEEAFAEWARELRARAYIELREPPL
jgi:peptidyl-prolyl cis-trans isomerase SurA